MNMDQLNEKYDEIYKKNEEIQGLLSEVEDYNDILVFLYETDIQRFNIVLNTMIDNYESLILKLREAHKDIKARLDEFGIQEELANGISENSAIPEKIKDLMLWKLRRLFMIYDERPVLPYIEGDMVTVEFTAKPVEKLIAAKTIDIPEKKGDNSKLNPEGGVFKNKPKSPAES